ncbi:MAG: hypothetical protein LRY73_04150 [Bacillus sp. (in: Bacteria)]|nr:hypothetical protein [Bacillus sp. (in: firmicutes)]
MVKKSFVDGIIRLFFTAYGNFRVGSVQADKFRQSIYRERSAEAIYRGLVDYFN